MYEMMTAPRPVDQISEIHLAEQADFLRQPEHFTPAQAYEVGHVAVLGGTEVAPGVREVPREAGVGVVAAEMWSSYTPFSEENTALYGSPEARQQAVETVRSIAAQAQLTGKYFSSAHKRAGMQLAAGELSQDEHDQQVGGILATLAVTNSAHLRSVGEVQRATIAKRVRAGVLPAETSFVDVTSRVTENGVELAGIDAVVARMVGARSQAELAQQALALKKDLYGQDAYITAGLRHQKYQAELQAKAAAVQQRVEERRMIDLLDEEAKAKSKEHNLAA